MPYVEGRLIHDADAHVMEGPEWLLPYADPDVRDRMATIKVSSAGPDAQVAIDHYRSVHADPSFREQDEAEIMLRKNWKAIGSFIKEDRPRALDLLGFASQLLFNTFSNGQLLAMERGADLDLAYGVARAHNRAMADFCSVDERLLPTMYVPLADFERSAAIAGEALATGAAALLVPSACPRTHSPSHVGLDPVWAAAEEARIPVVMHVGGGGQLLDPMYFVNGGPPVPDFHGGDENFRSVDYMAIPGPPMQTLATMIFDGVLERHPDLRVGVIEQGAIWLPSWMRQMESAVDAFHRHEERLHQLSLRPTEYVRRQVRVTPYPTEDAGWIIANTGDEVCLFSSDYPHVEGGRKPLERFEASLDAAGTPAAARDAFFHHNFVDLMGRGLPATVAAA
jgi:predicted TIM-barrel fold metal-dependent hydrolase